MEWTEVEVGRIRRLLRALVEERGTVYALERRLGVADASLRRVLNGEVRLTLYHVLLILDGIGKDRGDFFRSAFRDEGRTLGPGELRRRQEAAKAGSRQQDEVERAALLALLNILEKKDGAARTEREEKASDGKQGRR